jgi:hypothetical protein
MTLAVSIAQSGANNVTMRNRIINGAMMIDQRNAGASVTPSSNTYQLDRWVCNGGGGFTVQQNAGSVTPPAGFSNYYGVTSTGSQSASNFSLRQFIEGFNSADFGFGTANAQPITLSFWVRSSLTGTFGGAIQNSAGNRSYPYSYTITSANTWQQVIVTIPGDTSGTWVGATNGAGIVLFISYSVAAGQAGTANAWASADYRAPTGQTNVVGTNGATFYITGVQLEEGTTATAFEQRLYGTELNLCQRYFWPFIFGDSAGQTPGPVGWGESTTQILTPVQYPQTMRVSPSISTTNTAGEFRTRNGSGSIACSSVPYGVNINTAGCWVFGTVASGITLNGIYALSGNNSNVKLNFSAEL